MAVTKTSPINLYLKKCSTYLKNNRANMALGSRIFLLFFVGIFLSFLAEFFKQSNIGTIFFNSTLGMVGLAFIFSSVGIVVLVSMTPYIGKKLSGPWWMTKEIAFEKLNVSERYSNDRYRDDVLEKIVHELRKNFELSYESRQSLEEIIRQLGHRENGITEILNGIRQDLKENSLQRQDYLFGTTREDSELLRVYFSEISELNTKMEKEQEEIDQIKIDTHNLACETQKVLSILRERMDGN
jgi:hypothetical protein